MARQRTKIKSPVLPQAVTNYCRSGEEAAYYMHGLADGLEAAGIAKGAIHRLREHAIELSLGTLEVEHGYKDPDRPKH